MGALPWALVTPGGLMTHLPFASRNLSPARGLGRGDNRVRALRAARAQGRRPGSQLVAGHPGQALPQLPGAVKLRWRIWFRVWILAERAGRLATSARIAATVHPGTWPPHQTAPTAPPGPPRRHPADQTCPTGGGPAGWAGPPRPPPPRTPARTGPAPPRRSRCPPPRPGPPARTQTASPAAHDDRPQSPGTPPPPAARRSHPARPPRRFGAPDSFLDPVQHRMRIDQLWHVQAL